MDSGTGKKIGTAHDSNGTSRRSAPLQQARPYLACPCEGLRVPACACVVPHNGTDLVAGARSAALALSWPSWILNELLYNSEVVRLPPRGH